MKVVNKNTPFVLLILIAVTSCDRLFITPDPASSNQANFDLLWNTVDEKYSFFTYKNVDWNAARVTYRPQAEKAKNDKELFQVMATMLNELKDGHVNLTSDFDVSRNWSWYQDYPANFNWDIIDRNYLGRDSQLAGPFVTDTLRKVGYMYYGSFQSPIESKKIDLLFKKLNSLPLKGLIIDIRNNGGGALVYADEFIQHLLKQNTLIGYTRYKSGPEHDAFTNYIKNELDPKGVTYTGRKIVLLTNRQVYSAANYFASALSQLADVTIIGDQTGGGGGAPISAELQAGWRVRFSATQMFNADYQHLEAGVKPDIKVDISKADEAIGKDTILEEAIKFLNK
jgi:hypothetical protein